MYSISLELVKKTLLTQRKKTLHYTDGERIKFEFTSGYLQTVISALQKGNG